MPACGGPCETGVAPGSPAREGCSCDDGGMRVRLCLLLVAALALGCKRSSSSVRLVTEEEIASLQAQLMTRLEANARRTCPRPILRGAPAAGPAQADLLAITEPTGELARCATDLAGLATRNLKDLATARDPAMVELARRCGPLVEAAIAKAAAHGDACSPYQVGVRVNPDLVRRIQLAHLIGLHLRLRAEAGDPAGALWLALETVQVTQDLARGRTSLIDLMIGVASAQIVVEQATAIAGAHAVPPSTLGELSAAVGQLLAHQPSFSDTLLGERDYMELYFGAAKLAPPGWAPPGGWPEGMGPGAEPSPANTEALTHDPRDEHALMFYVGAGYADDLQAACPPTATLKACAAGFDEEPLPATGREVVEQLYKELGSSPSSTELRTKLRDAIVRILRSIARPSMGKYVKKRGRGVAQLAALRVHLELARLAATSGTCPPALALREELLAPPGLGERLEVAVAADVVELRAPAWTDDPEPLAPWRCPASAP